MAILKGFPPSNLVSSPRKITCDICQKEFFDNYPIYLSLSISGEYNYKIAPCKECWEIDQGHEWTSKNPNKWGDQHHVYSKARKDHTKEEIDIAHSDYLKKYNEGVVPHILRLEIHKQLSINDLRRHINGLNNEKEYTLIANEQMCMMFYEHMTFCKFGSRQGIFHLDGRECIIEYNPIIPEKSTTIFAREDI